MFNPIFYTVLPSPVGPLLVAGEGRRLVRTSFSRGDRPHTPPDDWIEDPHAIEAATAQLEEYFAGERTTFDLELVPTGTEFERRVWALLVEIPYGETRSYGELAERLGTPGSARAVGRANGANPLPIVVPCHRVIGADRRLVGFGGGLDAKRWLLRHEGALGDDDPRQASLFSDPDR